MLRNLFPRHSLGLAATLSVLSLALGTSRAVAGIVVSRATSFPTSPDLTVIDDTQDDGSVTLHTDRRLTQTFQVASGFTIDKFYIDTTSLVANKSFTVSIFSVSDTNAGAPNAVPTVTTNLLTTTSATTPSTGSGNVLEFDLTGSDEIFLAATTGSAGYALQLNRTEADGAFIWRLHESGDGTGGGTVGPDLYAAGQAYGTALGGGFTHGNSDYTLAFTAVPEPSTFALAALGVLGLIGLGRRRKR